MGLFDIFSGKSADNLRQAGQTAQSQLYGAGWTAQGAFNNAGTNAQRDFTALGSNAQGAYGDLAANAGSGYDALGNNVTQGYGNVAQGYGALAGQTGNAIDAATSAASPYYDQARGEYNGLSFAPDQYGSTMQSGYGALADASGANGAEGLGRARSLFTQTPGYRSGIDLAVDQANRIGNARGVAVGNTIGDATKLATTYADQNYGNFVGRLSPFANAPGQQLARDQAVAGYGAQLAGARAGIDATQGGNTYNAGMTKAGDIASLGSQGLNATTQGINLASQLGGRGVDLASQLGGTGINLGTSTTGQGYGLGYQGQTGGANAMLGAQTAGTQANLQAQEEAAKAQAASNAAAWNAILGGAKLAVGAGTGVPMGGGDLFGKAFSGNSGNQGGW